MGAADDILAEMAARRIDGAGSPRAQAAVERFHERVLKAQARVGGTEVKEFTVCHYRGEPTTYVILETGLPNDEGTAASIFCRDRRHVAIGRRGGIQLLNAKAKAKSRGWFHAVHALTR